MDLSHITGEYFEQFTYDPLVFFEKIYQFGSYAYTLKCYEINQSNKENIQNLIKNISEKYPQYPFPHHLINDKDHLKSLPIKLINYYNDLDRQARDLYKLVELEKHFAFRNKVEQFINHEFNEDWWSEIDRKYEKLEEQIETSLAKYEEEEDFIHVGNLIEKVRDETVELLEFMNKKNIDDIELKHIFETVCNSNKITEQDKKDKLFRITKGLIIAMNNFILKLDEATDIINQLISSNKDEQTNP
jgi:hypothetical protein